MKILFLANRIPYPPFRGDKLKIYNLARRLAQCHELHLVTVIQHPSEYQYIPELQKIFTTVTTRPLPFWKSALNCLFFGISGKPFQVLFFRSHRLKEALEETIARIKPDTVHVQHIRMAQYLENRSDLKRILDLPDAFSLYWERRKAIPRPWYNRIFDRIESRRVNRYEAAVIPKFDLCLACSPEDLEHLRQQHGAPNLELLPNGVDLETFHTEGHDYSGNKRILFTGNMDYAPNVDGVIYFVQEIFPRILQLHPDCEFIIAGQRPVKKVLDLAAHNIHITGFVPNLRNEYAKASVVVAPLRFGAGTQNKVIEAMAMGVPVVCTSIGFKGLGTENGKGVYMETTAAGFADRVSALLSDAQLRQQCGEQGKQHVSTHFNWDHISELLEIYCQRISGT